MLDEELSEKEANATECVDEAPKKGGLANLKKFDSKKGKEAALKRWSSPKKFASVRNYIKQICLEEVEKRAESIAKVNADFMEAGNLDGVRAIQEGLKGIGAHSENEERAMNLNMKMNADVKNSGSVKLVIEDMTKPDEDSKG